MSPIHPCTAIWVTERQALATFKPARLPGVGMGLAPEMLEGLPISNFVLPGLFLIGVMGLAPLVIAYGFWKRLPWAWAAAVTQGGVLVLWISLQIMLWGAPMGIQILYLVWGIVIVALCFAPGVKTK